MSQHLGKKIETYEDIVGWVEEARTRERTRNRAVWLEWLNNLAAFHGRVDLKLDNNLRVARRLTASQRAELEEIAVNWVAPHVRTVVAHLQKARPTVECMPSTTDEADIQAAKVGDRLLRSEWNSQDMDIRRLEACTWMASTGNGFLHTYFDRDRGPGFGGDDGEPIGQIVTESVNPFKIVFEPNRTGIESARWAIMSQRLPRDEIEMKYAESYAGMNKGEALNLSQGKNAKASGGDDVVDTYMAVVGIETGAVHDDSDFVDVDTFYHVPTREYPKGFYAIIACGRALYVGPYPYPFLGRLPFCHFKEILSPWRLYGETGTTSVLRAQEYFTMLRRIERVYMRKNSRGKWLIPQGLRIRKEKLTSLSPEDDFIPYSSANGNLKPEWISGQNPPNHIYQSMSMARDDGNRASGVNEASQGINPTGVSSGRAILALQEMDATRLGVTVQLLETEYGRWGQNTLLMSKEYYSEKRKYLIAGDALEGGVWFFDRADLADTSDVRCVPGSAMPQNKAAKQESAIQLFTAGILGNPQDPETLVRVRRMLEFGQTEDLHDDNALDEQVAERENLAMTNIGLSLMNAAGENPEILQQAVMQPGQWDDHLVHIKTHLRRWKKAGVRDNPALAGIIGQHIAMHAQALNPQQAPQQQGAPMQISPEQAVQDAAKQQDNGQQPPVATTPAQGEGSTSAINLQDLPRGAGQQ